MMPKIEKIAQIKTTTSHHYIYSIFLCDDLTQLIKLLVKNFGDLINVRIFANNKTSIAYVK